MLNRTLSIFLTLCALNSYTDETVWKGSVDSNGVPTKPIKLELHKQYEIKVSGFINLGKWVQAGEKLANDACYEFSDDKRHMEKFESIKNSQGISVCEGQYNDDHVYTSKPFVAKQNRIFFWVNDTNYDDNNGLYEVEIIQKK